MKPFRCMIQWVHYRALSALSACAARARVNGSPLDLEAIPFDDAATYALLGQGGTLGCFQLESPGMRSLLWTMKPRQLDDVIAAISLFRPGPLAHGEPARLPASRAGRDPGGDLRGGAVSGAVPAPGPRNRRPEPGAGR